MTHGNHSEAIASKHSVRKAPDQPAAAREKTGGGKDYLEIEVTSLPYFWVKLSCVCLMFAYRKKSNDL